MSVVGSAEDPAARLAGFRRDFYRCLPRRADALFELTDALLCSGGPVTSLVDLSLAAEHRRGHGALYDALSAGWIDVARLRLPSQGWCCPAPRTGGSCWPLTSATGCARTRSPAQAGCSATPTGAGRAKRR
ncbi:transposase [Micromonospora globbae]|uniref:Transposase n=1 Tax=Micromonospora globbae TaxID=1894969 RepID=A0ABZ1SEU3_9ACTN